MKRFLNAFTLAEVLITLSILGVIAVVVVPNIYNNYQKMVVITKLKRMYSYVGNKSSEIFATHNCSNLGCVITQELGRYNTSLTSATQRLPMVRLYFPEATVDNDNSCVPSEIYNLTSDVKRDTNTASLDSSKNRRRYCINGRMGLELEDIGMSDYGNVGRCINNNGYACERMYFYFNGTKKKAVLGGNVFSMYLKSTGEVFADTRSICNKNTKNNTNNGLKCFDYILKNNWKMDY